MDYTLFEKVRSIIVRQTGLCPESIWPTSSLSDNGGIDSLDQIEIIMDIEDTFDIDIPDEVAERMNSVSDILKYLECIERPDEDAFFRTADFLDDDPSESEEARDQRLDLICRNVIDGVIDVKHLMIDDMIAVMLRMQKMTEELDKKIWQTQQENMELENQIFELEEESMQLESYLFETEKETD